MIENAWSNTAMDLTAKGKPVTVDAIIRAITDDLRRYFDVHERETVEGEIEE